MQYRADAYPPGSSVLIDDKIPGMVIKRIDDERCDDGMYEVCVATDKAFTESNLTNSGRIGFPVIDQHVSHQPQAILSQQCDHREDIEKQRILVTRFYDYTEYWSDWPPGHVYSDWWLDHLQIGMQVGFLPFVARRGQQQFASIMRIVTVVSVPSGADRANQTFALDADGERLFQDGLRLFPLINGGFEEYLRQDTPFEAFSQRTCLRVEASASDDPCGLVHLRPRGTYLVPPIVKQRTSPVERRSHAWFKGQRVLVRTHKTMTAAERKKSPFCQFKVSEEGARAACEALGRGTLKENPFILNGLLMRDTVLAVSCFAGCAQFVFVEKLNAFYTSRYLIDVHSIHPSSYMKFLIDVPDVAKYVRTNEGKLVVCVGWSSYFGRWCLPGTPLLVPSMLDAVHFLNCGPTHFPIQQDNLRWRTTAIGDEVGLLQSDGINILRSRIEHLTTEGHVRIEGLSCNLDPNRIINIEEIPVFQSGKAGIVSDDGAIARIVNLEWDAHGPYILATNTKNDILEPEYLLRGRYQLQPLPRG
jgi:hypothetical protein